MKRDTINYFYVGIFVLLMLVVLILTVLRLTGQRTDTVDYNAVYNSITGVKNGTSISFGGYNIGFVKSVTPFRDKSNSTHFRVTMAIVADWPIPADSYASIIQPGLLSENQIEITEGKSNFLLKPGDTISSRDAINISSIFNELSADIKPLLKNMNSSFGTVSKDLAKKFPEITSNLNNLLKNLDKSAAQLASITNSTTKQKVVNIIDNADSFSQNLLLVSKQLSLASNEISVLVNNSNQIISGNKDNINSSIEDLHNSLASLSDNINSIIYNLDTASRNMNEFTRQLRDNPAILLSGKPPTDNAESK